MLCVPVPSGGHFRTVSGHSGGNFVVNLTDNCFVLSETNSTAIDAARREAVTAIAVQVTIFLKESAFKMNGKVVLPGIRYLYTILLDLLVRGIPVSMTYGSTYKLNYVSVRFNPCTATGVFTL